MLCVIILRISRPAIYLDWIVSGLLYIGLGGALASQAMSSSASALTLFCVLLLATALLRIWICSNVARH
jgi:hypothetical protein